MTNAEILGLDPQEGDQLLSFPSGTVAVQTPEGNFIRIAKSEVEEFQRRAYKTALQHALERFQKSKVHEEAHLNAMAGRDKYEGQEEWAALMRRCGRLL